MLTSGQDLGPRPWDAGRVRRFLTGRRLVALRALEFLADEGLTLATGNAVLARWLARQLAGLLGPIAAEVRIWTDALQGHGPRRARPRDTTTIQGYLRILEAPLQHGRPAMSRCGRSPPTT